MSCADERTARAHLSAAVEPGQPRLLAAVSRSGAVGVRGRILDGDRDLDPDGRLARRLRSVDPDQALAVADRYGIRFIVPGEASWPVVLDDLDGVQRDRRGGVPVGVWAVGRWGEVPLARSVALVGSRAATVYGTEVATEWAASLAAGEVAVVSGAAYGIDAAAHRGALAVGGGTIAVLACGLDQVYPRGNTALIERIAEQGALLSEAAPGAAVNRGRFLSRNRLIAALTTATVVVEAGARSGALSTARWASEILRPVGAVPGPVTSAMSIGPHQLVREAEAVLVSRPEEVVELVGELGTDAAPLPMAPATPLDHLAAGSRAVHEALPARGPVSVAELMAATGLTLPAVLAGLGDLADRGLVEGSGEAWVRRTARRAAP